MISPRGLDTFLRYNRQLPVFVRYRTQARRRGPAGVSIPHVQNTLGPTA